MPAPVDLAGQRFGRLVASTRTARPDRQGTWWSCRCDCGRETAAPLTRLRIADADPRAIRACEDCRARPCSVCGRPHLTPGSAATCGDPECRIEHRRANNRQAVVDAVARNPDYHSQRNRAERERILADPAALAARREQDAAGARRRRADRVPDPVEDERRREAARDYYARNADAVRVRLRTWLEAMPPERREAMRVAEIERKRQRILRRMLTDAAALREKLDE